MSSIFSPPTHSTPRCFRSLKMITDVEWQPGLGCVPLTSHFLSEKVMRSLFNLFFFPFIYPNCQIDHTQIHVYFYFENWGYFFRWENGLVWSVLITTRGGSWFKRGVMVCVSREGEVCMCARKDCGEFVCVCVWVGGCGTRRWYVVWRAFCLRMRLGGMIFSV